MKNKVNTPLKFLFLFLFGVNIINLQGCKEEDVIITKSDAKQITQFTFTADDNDALAAAVTGIIDQVAGTVKASVPNGTEVTSLTPSIIASAKATVSPQGAQDFSDPVQYTVTAEDGSKENYLVSVEIAPSDAKQILSFDFLIANNPIENNIMADIDESSKTIVFIMPFGTDLSALLPTIEVSVGASITPGNLQNFQSPVEYTVTAEDGTTVVYTAINELSQIGILSKIFEANPFNTLPWDFNDKNIENYLGVSLNDERNIYILNLVAKNISLLPPEIGKLTDLEFLNLIDNNLTTLPPEIGQLSKLADLGLKKNNLEDLPEEISQLNRLNTLTLNENNFKSFSPEIIKLSELQILDLTENEIVSLPDEIGELKNLISLRLGDNSINTLPNEIGQLSKLKQLDLFSNKLESIPEGIEGLTALESLFLNQNALQTLPTEIGKLEKLIELRAPSNKLTSIPAEISQLKNLNFLILTNNDLEVIPIEVCDMALNGTEVYLDDDVVCK